MHRRAADIINHGDPLKPLHVSLVASWQAACTQGITGVPYHPEVTAHDMVRDVSAKYTELVREEAAKKSKEWTKVFRHNMRIWNL